MLWQFLILSMTYSCSTCQVMQDKQYFNMFILLLFVHFRHSNIFKLANWRPVYQVENFQLNKNLISKNNFDSNCFGGIQLHLWYFSSVFFVGKINIYLILVRKIILFNSVCDWIPNIWPNWISKYYLKGEIYQIEYRTIKTQIFE